jgi:hypothetical protein
VRETPISLLACELSFRAAIFRPVSDGCWPDPAFRSEPSLLIDRRRMVSRHGAAV